MVGWIFLSASVFFGGGSRLFGGGEAPTQAFDELCSRSTIRLVNFIYDWKQSSNDRNLTVRDDPTLVFSRWAWPLQETGRLEILTSYKLSPTKCQKAFEFQKQIC